MHPRPILAVIVAAAVLVTACASAAPTPTPPPSAARPSVLPQIVSSELAVGPNRILFSFLDETGTRPVAAPDRSASVRFTGPAGETVEAPDGMFVWGIEDVAGVYVTRAEFPVAGRWTAEFTTSAPGADTETIPFDFDVKEDASVVRPGETAPSVDTPTLDDVGGNPVRLSTDDDPVERFYETSVADALAAGDPFVLAFATPKFCATAQCGPTLDRLKPIAEAHPDVTFINVEPYELTFTDGQLQPVLEDNLLKPVPAVTAYGLLTEPYIFVVDGAGIVTASFEAIFASEELEAALAELG